MVLVFMLLILSKRLSAIVALIVVPVVFSLAIGSGPQTGEMVMGGILKVAPTAIMLMFAILFFAVMYDAGLFEPAIRRIMRSVGDDPLRITIGTAALSTIISLDGDGSTTVLVVISAFLPVYLRLGMNPLILAVMLLLTNTILNVVPWGGPTARAASALHLDAMTVFTGLLPTLVIGLAYAFAAACPDSRFGDVDGIEACSPAGANDGGLAVALVINYPRLVDQKERIAAHSESVLTVIALIFAGGAFTGVLSGTGMVAAMSQAFLNIVPDSAGPYMSVIAAVAAIPFTFFMSNDAFFFGILPILSGAGAQYGVDPLHIARASLLGQPVHGLSPLLAPAYLLSGLLQRDVGDLQRYCLIWAFGSSFVLILAALATGAII
ncbi:unnamed protein product, partial [Mesorhabditis spiculigera]